MIILLPYPPDLPYVISEFPKYKADLQRWSRLSGFDPRIQGDIVLDNIDWDNPWKMRLENAVGEKVTNNKKGVAEILKFLEGCHELELLRNMRWWGRQKGESILGFVNLWETRLEFVKRSGVVPYQVYGVDLLYGCNLIKSDRDLIKLELSQEGWDPNCQNVVRALRRACHHDSLRTVDFEKLKMRRERRLQACCQIL